ncbi:MAG: hypothetical protein GY786_00215 [Proteobacteria bacterium]|nr:hypothetical protein [Pseudomonadota bacterium]
MIKINTIRTLIFSFAMTLIVLQVDASDNGGQINHTGKTPNNIIIMFTDGTGIAFLETARLFNRHVHNEEFFLTDTLINKTSIGLMSNYSAGSLVTDSAAAGSAMATGYKAHNGSVGVNADRKPVQSVAELIKERGGSVAVVSNANITDASPAAFGGAHTPNRREYANIASQLLNGRIDIVMGGGRKYFRPNKRKDKRDLVAEFKEAGYVFAEKSNQLADVQGKKLLALFAEKDMAFITERNDEKEPDLVAMTKTTLRLLNNDNEKGFLAFIENEHTDSASHRSDMSNALKHLIEFDKALKVAYQFYLDHADDTLLIVASDHETGGVNITASTKDMTSSKGINRNFPTFKHLQTIADISISNLAAAKKLGSSPTDAQIDSLMQAYYPDFLLDSDLRNKLKNNEFFSRTNFYARAESVLGEMIGRNTGFFYSATHHTNEPVFVLAFGPGSQLFNGFYDNTDFGKRLHGLISKKRN